MQTNSFPPFLLRFFSVSSDEKQRSDNWRDEILFRSKPREREKKTINKKSKQSIDAAEGRSYVFPRRPDRAFLAGLYIVTPAKEFNHSSNLLFI